MKKSRIIAITVLVILLVLIGLCVALVGFITDYMWFRELGYTSVFLKKLITQIQIGVPLFIVLTALAYIYLFFIKKGYLKRVAATEATVSLRVLRILSLVLSMIAAGFITYLSVSGLWFEILKFTNSTDFGINDPIFNLDVAFYVFKLQCITQLNEILISVIIAFVVLTVVFYFLLLSVCKPKLFDSAPAGDEDEEEESASRSGAYGGNGPYADNISKVVEAILKQLGLGGVAGARSGAARKPGSRSADSNFREILSIASNQVIVLGVLFFLMVSVNFFLRQYDLLYSDAGALFGAGFTDINVTLWMYRAEIVLALAAAVSFAIGVKRRKYKTVLSLPVLMIAVGALGTGAGLLVQNLVVSPDELNKETKYFEYSIDFTQNAYDLQDVQSKVFAADNTLTAEDIQNNAETFANIRINDYSPAKQFYNNTQTLRPYYSFFDVDVDRYMVNGAYTQTFLSAREVDEEKIDQLWINKYLKYTHGYGITLSRVDKVTANGQPDIMVRDIPPVSSVDEISIERPEIYFGELTDNYVLVNTDEQEFDYPDGNVNAFTFYEGEAGIKLGWLSRSLFAIREQSLKLFVSTNINSDSRIIINRNVKRRVQEIMPYLNYDQDPYIVVADGKLYWIIDAYTTSRYYPYSEPYRELTGDVNYIRNSVKVVIDAYNGDANYYLVDDSDPIANTFMKIYPKLFKPYEAMPESLQKHIRYPSLLLNIQANVYKRYHVNEVPVFYQGEDLWDISKELLGAPESEPMTPQYYIMKLPGESDVEFINSIPYTPKDKKNLTGLLVARNDGERYGELILYQLPKSKLVYGPEQIEAQIDQNDTIAKEFSLWKNSGSSYTRGNLFVIPIEQSLVYVEPVYLAANSSSMPEVRRVIVSYNDRIAYESTLSAALDSLFGRGASSEDGSQSGGSTGEQISAMTTDELILEANDAYERAIEAQTAGDWAGYGRELQNLREYLTRLLPEDAQTAAEEAEEVSDAVDTIN
ncbi:MAG: UPF0182 family protein [Clostridiales Family XIII bacterium]|nr:UPF0182 family protein [Clostridiales Family XIII bacterium]